jgi:Uma2 family endonuclease
MTLLVLDKSEERRLKAERAKTGADRFDEVWDGVYVMAALANNEHQHFATRLGSVFMDVVAWPDEGNVLVGCNVSDRETGWKKNYRCPDVAVFLTGNPAKDCDTHWFGGPDFAVEVISPNDRSRDKLGFYAEVGVRELLILDRKPWRLELYRLADGALDPAGAASVKKPADLVSAVLPLSFTLLDAKPRPKLRIRAAKGGKTWTI